MRFFLDNNFSPRTARALHCLLTPTHEAVHLKDKFPADAKDADWMPALARESDWIILSGDVNISRNPHEVRAWQAAGHTIFFLKRGWTNIPLWEQAAKLFHLFPEIMKKAEKAKRGAGFLVPLKGEHRGTQALSQPARMAACPDPSTHGKTTDASRPASLRVPLVNPVLRIVLHRTVPGLPRHYDQFTS